MSQGFEINIVIFKNDHLSFKCKSEIYKEMNSKETSLFKENSVFI